MPLAGSCHVDQACGNSRRNVHGNAYRRSEQTRNDDSVQDEYGSTRAHQRLQFSHVEVVGPGGKEPRIRALARGKDVVGAASGTNDGDGETHREEGQSQRGSAEGRCHGFEVLKWMDDGAVGEGLTELRRMSE